MIILAYFYGMLVAFVMMETFPLQVTARHYFQAVLWGWLVTPVAIAVAICSKISDLFIKYW